MLFLVRVSCTLFTRLSYEWKKKKRVSLQINFLLQDIYLPWFSWAQGNQSESYSASYFVHVSGHISSYLLPTVNGWA